MRAQVYLRGYRLERTLDIEDPLFSMWSNGALVWTFVLVGLVRFNGSYCTLEPKSWVSVETLFLLTTIAIAAKILVGPVLQVRKSIRLKGQADFEQPISYMLYDSFIIYPMNFLTGLFWKFTYVGLFGIFISLGTFFGFFRDTDHSIVPLPLFLARALMCMGRVSGLMIHRHLPHFAYLPTYALTVTSVVVVWINAEVMLKECGAQAGVIPHFSTFFAGVVGLPPIEIVVGLIAGLLAALAGKVCS
jgi:hypothetical protein